jgi:hypothetical protein
LLDSAVLHEGVFVDKDRLGHDVPVDFIDAVLVCKRNDYLVLQVITVNSKFNKSKVSISSGDSYSLRLKDVQSEETSVIIKQEDIIEI